MRVGDSHPQQTSENHIFAELKEQFQKHESDTFSRILTILNRYSTQGYVDLTKEKLEIILDMIGNKDKCLSLYKTLRLNAGLPWTDVDTEFLLNSAESLGLYRVNEEKLYFLLKKFYLFQPEKAECSVEEMEHLLETDVLLKKHVKALLSHYEVGAFAKKEGWNLLAYACRDQLDEGKNAAMARFLIENNNSSDCVKMIGSKGDSILHIAIDQIAIQPGFSPVFEMLIEKGADPFHANDYKMLALHAAAGKGLNNVVQCLLKVDGMKELIDAPMLCVNGNKDAFATSLCAAISYNQVETARLLIENGAAVNLVSQNGVSFLHTALYSKNERMVELLVEKEADVHLKDRIGRSPLAIAKENDMQNTVILLNKFKAEIQTINDREEMKSMFKTVRKLFLKHKHDNYDGVTTDELVRILKNESRFYDVLLFFNKLSNEAPIAYREEVQAQMDVLLKRYVVGKYSDVGGLNIWMYACLCADPQIVKLLLMYKNTEPDINKLMVVGQYSNVTPLISAIEAGKYDTVKLLLDKGADVRVASDYGRTVLHGAIFSSDIKILELLLGHKDIETVINKQAGDQGYTPLMMAITEGKEEMVTALISSRKVDFEVKTEPVQDDTGEWHRLTALCLAEIVGSRKIIADVVLGANANMIIEQVKELENKGIFAALPEIITGKPQETQEDLIKRYKALQNAVPPGEQNPSNAPDGGSRISGTVQPRANSLFANTIESAGGGHESVSEVLGSGGSLGSVANKF